MNYSLFNAKKPFSSGFTAVEVLVAVAIITMLMAVTVSGFTGFQRRQAVDKTANRLVSLVQKARYQTISSKNGLIYGVRFNSDRATLFATSYATGTSGNEVYLFDSYVKVSQINLIATTTVATTDVLFTKFSGEASATGDITISLSDDPSISKTVTIYSTGLIDSN